MNERHDRRPDSGTDSRTIGRQQERHQQEEFRTALRALLMTPLMGPAHEDFAAVRRQAAALREWFAREAGWVLQVERDGARLHKRPAELGDATRGLPGYDRRRYVLLCLACAVLERAEPQITLRLLGERLLQLAADPALRSRDFAFTLEAQHERRELVAVCRTLLDLGVLQRVAGDEEGFVRAAGEQADALYDVQRRALSGMLAAVRGPSSWAAGEAPTGLEDRLRALVDEHVADSEEARRTALRHRLARRLLDDPVVYLDTLDAESRAYFVNQRGAMAARLCEATGLLAEQRAEGLALADETGALTDVRMPAEGTEAHATLLAAEYLAGRARQGEVPITEDQLVAWLGEAKERFGRYWRKSAREPGAERELARLAIERLAMLQLVACEGPVLRPRPALARFALGSTEIRELPGSGGPCRARRPGPAGAPGQDTGSLFDDPT
ncbi:TIGR02678 family protein [Caldimonas tepidiphila]|uniref:TIGR02678 family protein n=1 Tax=Caldimonas tepidiphila TaxID=2315841 RepID=UPI000E5B2732|nr:TIGR02678 family protein [Caldimonas tepidiphila]